MTSVEIFSELYTVQDGRWRGPERGIVGVLNRLNRILRNAELVGSPSLPSTDNELAAAAVHFVGGRIVQEEPPVTDPARPNLRY